MTNRANAKIESERMRKIAALIHEEEKKLPTNMPEARRHDLAFENARKLHPWVFEGRA